MRLGVLLPHRAVVLQSARRPPLEVCWTVARTCDEAGLDLWVGDSVVAKPRLEPLTTLAYLAALTQRARLGTAVLLPALRQPTVLAHALANIDQISHGRLVLGLGVGWGLPEIAREWEACGRVHKRRRQDLEEHILVWRKLWSGQAVTYTGNDVKLTDHEIAREWEACGRVHKRRCQDLEEHIIVWRKLWSGQAVTYTGHDVKLTEHTIGPLPWHEAGPPILITAGNRGEIIPAQLDRFACLGDGIITTYLTDDDCRTLRVRCEEALARHGRFLPGFPMCVYTTVRLDADVAQAETLTRAFLQQYYGGGVHYRGLMGLGPASLVIDTLKRYEAAGVTDLCIRFAGTDQVAQLEQFIQEVVPAFIE